VEHPLFTVLLKNKERLPLRGCGVTEEFPLAVIITQQRDIKKGFKNSGSSS